MLTKIIEWVILPPGLTCILVLLGLIFIVAWRRLGYTLIVLGLIALYIGSIPLTTALLAKIIEPNEALTIDVAQKTGAQAIIVIGGERNLSSNEYGTVDKSGNFIANTESIDDRTLNRLRYTAKLIRALDQRGEAQKIEVILSGGQLHPRGPSRAQLMAKSLKNDFAIDKDPMLEPQSISIYESAIFTTDLLNSRNINKVILVGDAWDLPRAVEAFKSNRELEIIPAPVGFLDSKNKGLSLWLPQGEAMKLNNKAMGEIISRIIYRYFYL